MAPQFEAYLHQLRLNEAFRIAHGASVERQVLRIRWDGGIGEAPFVPYYPDDPEGTLQAVRALELGKEWSWVEMAALPRVARLALDVLWHDMEAKKQGLPIWKLLGLPAPQGKPGCRSLSIPEDFKVFEDKVRQLSARFPVLKLKLGGGNVDQDEEIVARARSVAPRAILFADVNGGWTPEQAARLIPRLERFGLAFVEQPVHHALGVEGWSELSAKLPEHSLPLFADESIQTARDVEPLSSYIHGVNVKLLKCGGYHGVMETVEVARRHRLKTLLGCMIESSVGITAAAHLAGLMDWIDLDGHFYVANDDYSGVTYDEQGALHLPEGTGLGGAWI